MCVCVCVYISPQNYNPYSNTPDSKPNRPFSNAYMPTNSVNRQNQTHAATHNICGLCVPRRQCPVVPLSLHLKTGVGTTGLFLCSNVLCSNDAYLDKSRIAAHLLVADDSALIT